MSLPSIETLGGQAVEPFSRQPARSEVVEQFREIVEQMVGRLNAHRHLDTEAPARAAAPGLGVSAAVATQLMLSVPTPSRHGLSATGSSMLLGPDQLDPLPADLVAGDPQSQRARSLVPRASRPPGARESSQQVRRGGRDRIPRGRSGRRPPKCRVRQRSSWVKRALHGRYREIYARGRAPLPASLEQRHRFKRIEGVPDLPKCCWRYRLRPGQQAPLSRSYLRN